MKKIILSIAAFLMINVALAQAPEGINYQAVVRDVSGNVIANQNVNYQISLLQNNASGNAVYVETHNLNSNDFGLTNFVIGNGATVSGDFTTIDWGADSYFVKIELDEAGGSNFTTMGTSQLMSVPYALHAKTADNVDDADADATNEIQTISRTGTTVTLSNGGGSFIDSLNTYTAGSGIDITNNVISTAPASIYTESGQLNDNFYNVTTVFQPVGPEFTINKTNENSIIEITLNSYINPGIFSGTSGVKLEIRIDGATANFDTPGNLKTSNSNTFVSMFAVFSNLSIGNHIVRVYARTVSGSTTNFELDSGGWGGRMIAKETF